MKIRTLTTYNVYNYGASLQAYALMTYLQNKGNDVKIINFQPEYLTRKYNYSWVNPESPMSKHVITRIIYRVLKYIQRQTTLKRKREFDYFNHKILQETNTVYHSYEELKNNPPQADLYIVGSDQIWNVFYETGQDPSFFLDWVKEGKKASYAASFSYLNISQTHKKRIKESLQSFTAISVREFHGVNILKDMNIVGTWVLDPIFLLNIKEWKKIMVPFNKEEKYLLIYDFERNRELKRFAIKYAKVKKMKIYSINDTYPLLYADRNFNNAGPEKFLSLIYNCDAFVSNSFHGTAFAILFNKPVFVFNRHRHKVNSRMESLMTLFGLTDCIITNPVMYISAIQKSFDFNKVNQKIKNELKKSKQFIDNLL